MARRRPDPADAAFRQLTEEGCTLQRLHAANRLAGQVYAGYFAETGLTAPQFGTLAFLYRDGSHAVGELAALLDSDQTTITRNLRLLEQRGLVRQAVAPEDRRRRVIRLTPEGRRAFQKALPLWQKAQAALTEILGRAQTAAFNRQLDEAMARLRET
ncbi:MAG TPA: MarR family winged helix-turn-helix transcriptional regulator [Ferrovibrio sp.]|jgi:DNA-binding MarR family transcriptional regulator|uniref:MarR family winged helix-turn-helix transcriptional regulator n=1 Tax=Ferrovibrio sp. TaxID=1917215 RepID=UPI002B4ADFDF|nr:MarR family winged helix-turn-helix transcriptional regulator [Ferrovibrio sp.]HLT76559.1 MarR family winged helix-turn-helix transcriptional regulator [Ferrovibrio sp.]